MKKTFDCVEMKRRAQEELMAEYEQRKHEFSSIADFINTKSRESEWQRDLWDKVEQAQTAKGSTRR